MSGFGSLVVQGLPSDDWNGADKPGRKWGMGTRIEIAGERWMVVGVMRADLLSGDSVSLRRYDLCGEEEWMSLSEHELDQLFESE